MGGFPHSSRHGGSRKISHKAQSGEWNYDLKPIFFLGLLNFDIRHLEPEKADPLRFIHKFSLREDETHEQMSQALRFAFMEVARFNKTKEECGTFEERFLWIMKNLPTFAEKPELWDDPYFDDIMEQAEFANMSWEEQEKYIASMKQKWDYKNTLDFAEQKGLEKGREEGREQQVIEIARRMLSMGLEPYVISQATGLTEEQIKAL